MNSRSEKQPKMDNQGFSVIIMKFMCIVSCLYVLFVSPVLLFIFKIFISWQCLCNCIKSMFNVVVVISINLFANWKIICLKCLQTMWHDWEQFLSGLSSTEIIITIYASKLSWLSMKITSYSAIARQNKLSQGLQRSPSSNVITTVI